MDHGRLGWRTMAVMLGLAAACAKSEPPKTEAAAAPPAPPAGPNVVEVVAKDFAYTMPDTLPAGPTTFHLVNQGQSIHHIQVMRLEEGKTMADFAKVNLEKGPPPSWIVFVGGPNASVPGKSSDGTVELTPGNYVVLCAIPGPDGVPHVGKGMIHGLTVVPSDVKRAMPEPDLTLTLNDYSFTFSKPLTAGKHVIRVENGAQQPHEVLIGLLPPGKKAADLPVWVMKQQGPPPAMPLGGTTMIHPGGYNIISVELAPGEYGFWCFFNDAKDGKPHFAHGMMQQITVQ